MSKGYAEAWERLAAGEVLILDGGVSTELERRGVDMSDEVWSGRAAVDAWEAVVAVHRAYLDAGADIITTNTYASSRLMLEPAGLGDQTEDINRRAIEAALTARERAGRPEVLVAGSLSHMIPISSGADLPKDREGVSAAALRGAFRELAGLHREGGADVLLLEMMSAPSRMTPMFEAVAGAGLPVWCGLSARRRGDRAITAWHEENLPFADILALAAGRGFDVLGVMHSAVDVIDETLSLLRNAHSGPLMVYPDSGHFEMPHWHFEDSMTPARFRACAQAWREAGVQILGGCCGLGPEHIAAIADLKGPAPGKGPGG